MEQTKLTQRVELTKGQKYEVEAFPEKRLFTATYIGQTNISNSLRQVFKTSNRYKTSRYLFVDSNFIIKDGREIITHKPYSSISIWNYDKKQCLENLEFTRALRNLGEQI